MKIEQVLEARERLQGVVRRTPLLRSGYHPELYLKAENFQVTGSFKIRAAFNEIAALPDAEKEKGVVTSSSGNFAQGVAYAARMLGISAHIVMMKSANPLKVERTRKLGGQVVWCDDRFEARAERVAEIHEKEGRTIIHPYDHPDVVAGNGTIALEILEQCPDVENIVVPISGGGLVGGVAFTAGTQKPSIKIWGVQPRGSNAAYLSFQQKQIVSIDRARTIADGLRVTRPGELPFSIMREHLEDVVVVEEESIVRAVQHFLSEEKLVVEPSGAVPMAAVLENKVPLSKTVLVLSGGNMEVSAPGLGLRAATP